MSVTPHVPPRRVRVLLVEQDADLRWLLTAALERRGCEVREACGVAEAKQALEADPLDVVISEMRFVDGTGSEVARYASERVSQDADSRGPLLLALTGLDYRADLAQPGDVGFHRYFLKPTSIRELAATIAERYPH